MGDVWAATHVLTGRGVAIKQLRTGRAVDRGNDHARFLLEAQAACAVEHPNVVGILDFLESDDEPPIIVMERLRGETLADTLARNGALSTAEDARRSGSGRIRGGTAHARGIVHRDLKPGNIFLRRSANAGDEGPGLRHCQALRAGSGRACSEDRDGFRPFGTPCYMAPEQALGERGIDHRADVWALGVILYECLSGMRPIEGENGTQIMMRLMSTGIMPLESLVPGLPAELAELAARLLARDPRRRPNDLNEVQRVLYSLTPERAPGFGAPAVALTAGQLGRATDAGGTAPDVAWGSPTPQALATREPRLDGTSDGIVQTARRRRVLTVSVVAALLGLGALATEVARLPVAPNPTTELPPVTPARASTRPIQARSGTEGARRRHRTAGRRCVHGARRSPPCCAPDVREGRHACTQAASRVRLRAVARLRQQPLPRAHL